MILHSAHALKKMVSAASLEPAGGFVKLPNGGYGIPAHLKNAPASGRSVLHVVLCLLDFLLG